MNIIFVHIKNRNLSSVLRNLSNSGRRMNEIMSGLSRIEISKQDGIQLFREWHEEASANIFASFMNLATSTKDGNVSNRSVVMREIKEDGITFCTPHKGKKRKQIEENPYVAVCFLWQYKKNDRKVMRQVRMEGTAAKLHQELTLKYFDEEPVYCKIRANICDQGDTIEWSQLKERHDSFLKRVKEEGIKIDMPKDYEGYKIVPTMIDFYHSHENEIADRIVFKQVNGEWTHSRICT